MAANRGGAALIETQPHQEQQWEKGNYTKKVKDTDAGTEDTDADTEDTDADTEVKDAYTEDTDENADQMQVQMQMCRM